MTRTQKSLLAAIWLVPLVAFPTDEIGGTVPGFGRTRNGLFSPAFVALTWRSAEPSDLFVDATQAAERAYSFRSAARSPTSRGPETMNILWRYWLTWIAGAIALTVYVRTRKGSKIPALVVLNSKTLYRLSRAGEETGPYQASQMLTMWEHGMITADSFCWAEGWADWRLVSEEITRLGAPTRMSAFVSDSVKDTEKGKGRSPRHWLAILWMTERRLCLKTLINVGIKIAAGFSCVAISILSFENQPWIGGLSFLLINLTILTEPDELESKLMRKYPLLNLYAVFALLIALFVGAAFERLPFTPSGFPIGGAFIGVFFWWRAIGLFCRARAFALTQLVSSQSHIEAAHSGDVDAQFQLGLDALFGHGVAYRVNNYPEAVRWFTLASKQNHSESQVHLGMMYQSGMGVPKSCIKAHTWLSIAKANGNNTGIGVKVVELEMTPLQISEASNLAKQFLARLQRNKSAQSAQSLPGVRGFLSRLFQLK